MATPTRVLTTYDPDLPDYTLTTTKEEYLAENAETFSDEERAAIEALGVGEALSVPSGGGCFFVVVGVSEDGETYRVAFAEGEYIGLHHGRPEPIEYRPIDAEPDGSIPYDGCECGDPFCSGCETASF